MGVEECWRECCEWLFKIRLIRDDHLLRSPNAQLIDLCKFLRDGVMICKILHIVDEDSIDLRTINQRPQNAQFLCMKNIGIFLQTCTRKFDLNKEDLFEPPMLFELSDIGKVLHTLSRLSKSAKAQRLGVEGFPAEQDGRDDDDIYSELPRDIMNGRDDDENTYWNEKEAYCFREEIYTELRLGPTHQQQWNEESYYSEIVDEVQFVQVGEMSVVAETTDTDAESRSPPRNHPVTRYEHHTIDGQPLRDPYGWLTDVVKQPLHDRYIHNKVV